MNISGTTAPSIYNVPNTNKIKVQTQEKQVFSINVPAETSNHADKVSISNTAADMADIMDPSVPEGAMPEWWGKFAIRVYLPSERAQPGFQETPDNARFANLSSGEAAEYFTLLQAHTSALYERNGLIDDESKYKALNSRSTNERLRQEFFEGMRNDPRMSELVGKLGIPLS